VVPAAKLDPLHKQPLPPKLTALEDIFSAVHTVHEMLKRRGKRTTFANMKAAVEEASRRRFTVSGRFISSLPPSYASIQCHPSF